MTGSRSEALAAILVVYALAAELAKWPFYRVHDRSAASQAVLAAPAPGPSVF